MGRGLSDPKEMQIIYDVSKDVYRHCGYPKT